MSDSETIRVGDIGTIFEVVVKENAVVVPISAATVKNIKFRKPSNEILEKTASFKTNGTDGTIIYTAVEGDLDEAGLWEIQGYIELPGWKGHTQKGQFYVEQAMPDPV